MDVGLADLDSGYPCIPLCTAPVAPFVVDIGSDGSNSVVDNVVGMVAGPGTVPWVLG